jgi:predicted GNAT family acetyltransferase
LACFVLNGTRVIGGKKVAWNGGTGVIPKYRGQGVGQVLIQACIEVYRDQQVDTALLEAIAKNTPAIKLYEKFGYRVIEHVTFLNREGAFNTEEAFDAPEGMYQTVPATPFEVSRLTFYRAMSPWQTQWQSLKDGQAFILHETGTPVGYALYRRTFNDRGELVAIALHQCAAAPNRADEAQIIACLLKHVYDPADTDCRRYTVNIPVSSHILVAALTKAGFQTLTQQVYMHLDLSE